MPVTYKQVTPNSGLDWVSQPNWLMVPQNSSNQAIAVTPASSSFTVNFSVQPSASSQGTTVSPTSTTSANQTLTVSGTAIGESTQVQPGVGSTVSTGTSTAGLGIDIKPMTTGTIAIHGVTQHYTQPMAPPSISGSFTSGTVCVTWSHVEHSTPVPPDHDGPYGSGEILTGSDGICHTTAVDGDTQVIPVGQGIPADIVPQDVPSASDLQTYLNQVFGKQANLFFIVTRNDFTCDYDVMTTINGILDLWEGQGAPPSKEQAVIEGYGTSGVTANIFYVKDYQGLPLSGTTADHSSIGITNYKRHVAYVRDCTGILQVTAHETGHVLDLGHTDADTLSSHDPNPASTDKIPDPSPSDRLMYPYSSGSNTRLIQPEWDIVNPNKRS